jgi:hypothetical protein
MREPDQRIRYILREVAGVAADILEFRFHHNAAIFVSPDATTARMSPAWPQCAVGPA